MKLTEVLRMAYDRRGGRGGGGRGGFRSFGRPRFGGRRPDLPKPIKVGEEYDVEIDEVGSKGDGIARIKNFVVFVSGANKGDKIKIKITEVASRFAIGEKVGAAGEGGEAAETTEAESTEEAAAEETIEAAEEPAEAEAEEAAETAEEAVEEAAEEVAEAAEE
jgi:predicted RNA-binding protein with TRAM domain